MQTMDASCHMLVCISYGINVHKQVENHQMCLNRQTHFGIVNSFICKGAYEKKNYNIYEKTIFNHSARARGVTVHPTSMLSTNVVL